MPSQLPSFSLLVTSLCCCGCGWGAHSWVRTLQKSLLPERTCIQAQRMRILGVWLLRPSFSSSSMSVKCNGNSEKGAWGGDSVITAFLSLAWLAVSRQEGMGLLAQRSEPDLSFHFHPQMFSSWNFPLCPVVVDMRSYTAQLRRWQTKHCFQP